MKHLIFILCITCLNLSNPCKALINTNSQLTTVQKSETDSTNLLNGIQGKVDQAFLLALKTKQAAPLLHLDQKLNKIGGKNSNPIITYWQSYLSYYLSICHLQLKDKKNAEESINKAIELIENMENKNAEDYALLAYEQSFSCQFKPGIIIPFVSKKLKRNCETALQIDSLNMRAYFVLGSNDFYTPEMFGGGKSAEKMLLKAIDMPEQKIANPFLPSWGKMNAYELLIRWYIRKEKWNLAHKYYQEGLKKYPTSFLIQELASKIKE
ncbi:hypothetical protein EO244_03190 [Ancylomarina salipaludis]|uniref:Tetratricopeptide repeat protein n=1 Tax=Ancylomarina salipaludis TaxID=2501299 RepID=A0A4Q1JP32_9BACT|nr:hypothetical protein [Ancylomarina salipaludis]RXQ96645.1 hypothetical protein EO244_03190 [Ancylomarina salipaludis]